MGKKIAIQTAQIRQMFSTSNITQITSVILAAILGYMLREVLAPALVFEWFCLVLLVALSRTALAISFNRLAISDSQSTHIWLRNFRIGVFSSGVAWGSVSFLLFPSEHIQYQALIAAMLCGLAAGGLTSYSIDFLSGIVYITLVLMPLIIRMFYEGSGLSVAMGIALLLYLFFMLMSLRYMNRNLSENIILHLEAAARENAVHRESEKNLALLHNASDGIHILDLEGNIIEVSDSFCAMLGYQRNDMIGMNVSQWDGMFEKSELPKVIRQQHERKTRSQFETLHQRKDGTAFNVEISGFPLELDGKPMMFYSSRNITERKQFEQQLRKFKDIIESTDEAIISKSLNGIIESWNKGAERVFGYTAEEAIGHPIQMLIPPEYLKEESDILERVKSGEHIEQYETIRCHKDGRLINMSITISPILDNNGIVIGASNIARDTTEHMEYKQRIEHMAHYDKLTRLPNRTLFFDRLQQALATARRDNTHLALLFVDLDKFKPINDTLGHDVGDMLLAEAARRMRHCVRESDTVARFGGDEFVILLTVIDAEQDALLVAEKIRETLCHPFILTGHNLEISSSIGVVVYPEHGSNETQLMKNADVAMYCAKESGRNDVKLYQPGMKEE